MDVVTLGAALNGSKAYTDQVTQSLMGGVHYRGSVNYYSDLPNDAEEGDSYTVKYAGTSGTVADGTEYTWGYDTDSQDFAWISFSKDTYSKAEIDNKLVGSNIALTGYAKGTTAKQDVSPTDNVNQGLGKIEKRVSDNETNILLLQGNKTFSDEMFDDSNVAPYVSTDIDGQRIATFAGTSGTIFWYTVDKKVAPKKVILFEIWAKSNPVNDGNSPIGTGVDIRFFDADNVQIGQKYSMEVLTSERYGYHRYQHISPAGTDHYTIRVFTRNATTATFKMINVKVIDCMPMVSDNSISFDSHLGTLKFAPRNTWSAYEMAKQMGFKNLIVNVKSTSDNKLVCIHNDTIDATSDGTGAVSSYTYEQLLQYDFGSWFSKYYKGEKIPLFDDVLSFIHISNMNLIVSIHSTNTNADIDAMYTLIKKHGLLNGCILKSENRNQIEYIYSVFGDDVKYDYVYNGNISDVSTWIETFGHLDYIETEYTKISDNYMSECRQLGLAVIGTTVDYVPYVWRTSSKGVSRYTTDMCADMVL